jgi:Tfp pilus assembly protein PilO
MSIFLKLLPIILLITIFYLLIYNLYPGYQELISLTKKLNELQNKEKEINTLLKLVQSLSQNPNVQQLIANKEVLDLWLPQEPKTEEILAFLVSIYQTNNLIFKGTDLSFTKEAKVYNANVLPVKVINFSIDAELDNSNMLSFIEALEGSARLMVIKKARISSDKKSQIEVETYYFSKE